MADVLPTEPAVEALLRDFLAAELRQAELDFPQVQRRRAPSGDRPRLRIPAGLIGAAVVIAALIALGPRFSTGGIGGTGAPHASASAVAPGSSAISALPSPSVGPSVAPSPSTGVFVDCGRISPEACAKAIDLVRAGHQAEVAGATRIVMDDTCPPTRRSSAGTMMTTICDRLYPFDTIVVVVTAGGDTTGWYAFSVVGLDVNTPTTVEPWVGEIPSHILETLREP